MKQLSMDRSSAFNWICYWTAICSFTFERSGKLELSTEVWKRFCILRRWSLANSKLKWLTENQAFSIFDTDVPGLHSLRNEIQLKIQNEFRPNDNLSCNENNRGAPQLRHKKWDHWCLGHWEIENFWYISDFHKFTLTKEALRIWKTSKDRADSLRSSNLQVSKSCHISHNLGELSQTLRWPEFKYQTRRWIW
jgi:hypothetical protein